MSVTLEFIMAFQIYKYNFSLILSTITQMRKLESQTLIDLGHFIKLTDGDMKAGLPFQFTHSQRNAPTYIPGA